SFSPQSNAVRKSRAARKEQHRDRHTHSHSQPLKAPCGYGWPNSPSAERKTRGDRPSEVVVKNVQRSVLRPTPRGAEGWPPRAGSASRHASPAGGVWTEQHLQEGEGEEEEGKEEEMERARQVGAHCVKAALPVEGSIEAAQRQRHASRGAQGRTHTQIHRHISKHRLRTSARPAEAAAVTPPPRAAPGPGPMAPRPRERLSVEGSMPCSAWGED
ncbi:unnamed protein product, partial [Prorocentrum cordatum]